MWKKFSSRHNRNLQSLTLQLSLDNNDFQPIPAPTVYTGGNKSSATALYAAPHPRKVHQTHFSAVGIGVPTNGHQQQSNLATLRHFQFSHELKSTPPFFCPLAVMTDEVKFPIWQVWGASARSPHLVTIHDNRLA